MIKNNIPKMIVTGLIGFLGVGVLFFIGTLLYSSYESIWVGSLNSRAAEYDIKAKEFGELEAAYKEWKDMDNIYARFKNDYMIKFDDYPGFRQEMQRIFNQNGLQVLKINHKYKNIFNDIQRVAVELQLVGNYRNIKRFIFEIENKTEMILFNNFSLSKYEGSERAMGRFLMEVYFVK